MRITIFSVPNGLKMSEQELERLERKVKLWMVLHLQEFQTDPINFCCSHCPYHKNWACFERSMGARLMYDTEKNKLIIVEGPVNPSHMRFHCAEWMRHV